MRAFVAVLVLAACGRSEATPAPAPAADQPPACEVLPFPLKVPVAEASGAALIAQGLIVVADSGNHGEYVILDPESGDTREHDHLPLPAGLSDDIEGVASPDGATVYALVSDGTLLRFTRADHGFALAAQSRIGDARDRNYEGLCLDPAPKQGACDGYAASKADGHLYCLRNGAIDPQTPPIAVAPKNQLADCNYSPDGKVLLAAGNVFAADRVWRIEDGAPHELAILGPGNGEVVVAAPGGIVYRFSDLNDAPSLAGKYRCSALAR
jgi:hypothetical protein